MKELVEDYSDDLLICGVVMRVKLPRTLPPIYLKLLRLEGKNMRSKEFRGAVFYRVGRKIVLKEE